jgi:ketosteroid isomerase-like protein
MDLLIRPNCGNSPKMKLVQDLTIYFASYAIPKVMDYLTEDIKWTLVGDSPIEGKANFEAALQSMSDNKASKLTIHQILTHGKEAAVHGEMVMEDGKTYAFADFYEFASAKSEKVKAIVSYVIPK